VPRFAGLSTFARLPRIEDVTRAARQPLLATLGIAAEALASIALLGGHARESVAAPGCSTG
jgi:hypothetical protein